MTENNDSYKRWQSIRINQLGFINNLVLGLSVALLAYNFEFVQSDGIELNCLQKFLFWISSILLTSSVIIALILTINRLEDYRLTARIARKREKGQSDSIEKDRIKVKRLENKTWCLFYWQISTFGVSFLTSAIYIIIELNDKLS